MSETTDQVLPDIAHCMSGYRETLHPAGAWLTEDGEIVCRACWELVPKSWMREGEEQ